MFPPPGRSTASSRRSAFLGAMLILFGAAEQSIFIFEPREPE